MRIVPEWKEYDYKIKVLWDKVYGTNTRLQTEYDPSSFEDNSKEGKCYHKHTHILLYKGARCSSVVRAFAHGAMGRRIDPSWWTH